MQETGQLPGHCFGLALWPHCFQAVCNGNGSATGNAAWSVAGDDTAIAAIDQVIATITA